MRITKLIINKHMKLAEALSLRKDLETRVALLKTLLGDSSRVQEGDEPGETPESLMEELDGCLEKLEYYVYNINVTNMNVKDENGKTMTKLLSERDTLRKRIDVLDYAFKTITGALTRYSRNEVRHVVTIDQKTLRSKINQLSQQYRQLDMKIQTMNYTYDLMTS